MRGWDILLYGGKENRGFRKKKLGDNTLAVGRRNESKVGQETETTY